MRELISRAEAKAKGLKQYFTGEPCKHKHIGGRFVSSSHCVVCSAEKSREYMTKNPAEKKEQKQKYRAKNPDKYKEYNRNYRIKDPERAKRNKQRYKTRTLSTKILGQIEAGKSLPNVLSDFDAMDIFKTTSTDVFTWDPSVIDAFVHGPNVKE